jgi:hypothetical protein
MWPFGDDKAEKTPYDGNRKKDGRTKSGFAKPKQPEPPKKVQFINSNARKQLEELEK